MMMVFCAPLRGGGGGLPFASEDIGYMVFGGVPLERSAGGLRRREIGALQRVMCLLC